MAAVDAPSAVSVDGLTTMSMILPSSACVCFAPALNTKATASPASAKKEQSFENLVRIGSIHCAPPDVQS
jgi:hypothetical protein